MTKAFVMIKQLKAQGCRVVLVETSKYWMVASRFSNCVDRFVTVPIPEKEPEAYLDAMARLAEEENADLFVPVTSPVASQYEARLHRRVAPSPPPSCTATAHGAPRPPACQRMHTFDAARTHTAGVILAA